MTNTADNISDALSSALRIASTPKVPELVAVLGLYEIKNVQNLYQTIVDSGLQ